MPHGTLEVVLVSVDGLENADFLCVFSNLNSRCVCMYVLCFEIIRSDKLDIWYANSTQCLDFMEPFAVKCSSRKRSDFIL